MTNEELVRAEIVHRKEFVAALEKVAKLAEQLVGKGNGAAMREALNQLRDWALLDINENAIRPDEPNYKKLVDGIVEITNAALDAPPRNCDRFADETDAQIAFLNEVWLISVTKETALERDRFENWTDKMRSRYARWLFAPATEREGETNDEN